MSAPDKPRIEFIDLAKGICIILVVALHVLPGVDDKLMFLPYIRMPLYYCLSGLFFRDYGSFKNFSLKKINNILIPFLAWYLIGYGFYFLGRAIFPADHEATYRIDDLLYKTDFFNVPIWFLLSLFWSNLLFMGINYITKKWIPQFLLTLLLAGSGLMMGYFKVFNFLYFGVSLSCMPFFFLGYMLKKTTLLYPSSSKKRDFLIMCGCLIIGLFLAFYPGERNRIIYFTNEMEGRHIYLFYVTSILLVVALLLLTKFIKRVPFVTYIGRYSIIVLVTHTLLKGVYNPLLHRVVHVDADPEILAWVEFVLILASMFIVIPLCKKFLPHITAQKQIFKIKKPLDSKVAENTPLSNHTTGYQ